MDGSGTRRLTSDSTSDFSPAWSPDSQQIVFSSDRDGNDEIYVMNTDGSNVRRLTHNNAVDAEPDWSPDGSRFVFWSDRDGNVDIYVMDADGANVQRLTITPTPTICLPGHQMGRRSRLYRRVTATQSTDERGWKYVRRLTNTARKT